jgi:hypothetical protein
MHFKNTTGLPGSGRWRPSHRGSKSDFACPIKFELLQLNASATANAEIALDAWSCFM